MRRYSTEQPRFASFALVAVGALGDRAGDAADDAVVPDVSVGPDSIMKSVAAYLVTVIVLLAVGGVLWNASKREAQLAAAEYRLVTLRYDTAAEELTAATTPSVLDPILRRISPPADAERAAASYWGGDLQAAERVGRSGDAAARDQRGVSRACGRPAGPGRPSSPASTRSASATPTSCATNPTNEDAAYNYEFIVRLRGLGGCGASSRCRPATTPTPA